MTKRLSAKHRAALALAVCLLTPVGAQAFTAIDTVVPTLPPPSLVHGAFESDTQIALIQEQTNFVLPDDVQLDSDGAPGLYDQRGDATGSALPAGTVVDVHLLHFDPVDVAIPALRLTGEVAFGRPIVGLAFLRTSLLATDIYGAAGTEYPTLPTASFREFEFSIPGIGVADSVAISPGGMTLTLNWGATKFVDQLRVFTAVPEPAGMMLGSGACTCLAFFAARRRGLGGNIGSFVPRRQR